MEADSEDKEDTCEDSDKSSQGGHDPSSALHNQDQGGAEGLSRSYHDHGEALELLNDEVFHSFERTTFLLLAMACRESRE